ADHDFILANRRGSALGRKALSPVQNFGNALASRLIEWGWGYAYHDLGPLRLIRRTALEQIAMGDRGFGWTVEMQARAVECGLRICELPAQYFPRQGGRSKISGTLAGSFKAGTVILGTLGGLYWRQVWQGEAKGEGARGKGSTGGRGARGARTQAYPEKVELNVAERGVLWLSALLLLAGAVLTLPHGDLVRAPEAVPRFWWGMGVMNLGFVLSWGLRSVGGLWFWGIAIATRLIFLGMYPGDDIWRYLWEGYVQTLGFSPYEFAPNAEILESFRTPWWTEINHTDVSAIYPPMTQLGFWVLATIRPAVTLFKLAFIAADLGICALLSHRFGPRATLLYAWNPLVIYSFAGGAHYDSWFLLPLVAAWLWFDRPYAQSYRKTPPLFHWLGSALLLGVSIAVKWMSLPILGFLTWRALARRKLGLALLVVAFGLLPGVVSALPFCTLQTCPLIPTDSFFVVNGRSAELIPHLVAQVWPASRESNHIYAVPLLGLLAWLVLRKRTFREFAESYLLGLMLLTPIVHAWYFTWLVPFAVASRNWGTKLVSLSAYVYFVLPYRKALGDPSWVMQDSERLWLWLPFVAGLLWTTGRKFSTNHPPDSLTLID
ncbi:MAG: glycosyltransferase family 2 protein, partial [Cyanobacteria bacterium P01_G01_bin.38]